MIKPLVWAYDPAARLVLIISGRDIDTDGRANRWELMWDFPTRYAHAMFIIGFLADTEYEGLAADAVLEEVLPFSVSRGLLGRAASNKHISFKDMELLWQTKMRWHEALPLTFQDSPVAVSTLIDQGVDFIAGDTDLVLVGRTLHGGKTVWEVDVFDITYQAPFVDDNHQQQNEVEK